MSVGWGVSVGAQNMVCVAVGADAEPVVTGRRAATSTGSETVDNVRGFGDLLCAPQLLSLPDSAVGDLIAHAVEDLMVAAGAVAEHTVLAHPAVYRGSQLTALGQALDRCGLGAVDLVPEPLAAAAALYHRVHSEGPDPAARPGPVLVYDLGATSLDLAVVVDDETGPRIAGTPVRSYRFGGRCTAAAIAAADHDLEPDLGTVDFRLAGKVRVALVGESAPLIEECLRTAGLRSDQLAAVLLVGGAAAPPEVAHALADLLRCLVVRGSNPAQSIALGAALLGAQRRAPDIVTAPVRRASARVALALATIAAPVFASAGAEFAGLNIPAPERVLAQLGEQPSPGPLSAHVARAPEPALVIGQATERHWAPSSMQAATAGPLTVAPAMTWIFDPPSAATPDLPATPSDDRSAVVSADSTDFPVITVHHPEPEAARAQQHHDDPSQPPAAQPDPSPLETTDPTPPAAGSGPTEPVDNASPSSSTPIDHSANLPNLDAPAATAAPSDAVGGAS